MARGVLTVKEGTQLLLHYGLPVSAPKRQVYTGAIPPPEKLW